jgi:hypothetical protein
MSFTLDLIVGPVSKNQKEAFALVEALRERYYDDDRPKVPALVALHEKLIARYPCMASYGEDDPEVENCPWADGPMINNFAHEMGMVAIRFSRADEVAPFVIETANLLGITVFDGQAERFHRP